MTLSIAGSSRDSGVAIRTEHLTCDFGAVRALDDVSLEVPAGIVFGFLGPNGSGKTTTIRLLLGLLEPTGGHAAVLGLDTHTQAAAVRARCGALLEHDGLYERLSAAENLDYYGRIWRIPGPVRAQRIRELLDHVGLWERRADRVGTWSRGMKQKLAVARALLHQPEVVFLDEPTASLDPVAAAALREDLARLWAGVRRPELTFRARPGLIPVVGGLFLLYTLAIYPVLGWMSGHAYPRSPMFGVAPCPVTIFTFGLLLWTTGRVPKYLLVIPLLWSLLGFSAASSLGIREDYGLVVAGVLGTALLLWRDRVRSPGAKASKAGAAGTALRPNPAA